MSRPTTLSRRCSSATATADSPRARNSEARGIAISGRSSRPGDQLVGFLEPALRDAHRGEQRRGVHAPRALDARLDRLERGDQRLLGLVPLPLLQLVLRVAHHAERQQRRVLVVLHVGVEDLEPPLDARHVGGERARFDHVAEDIAEDARVLGLAAGGGCERRVEQIHALVDMALAHAADAHRGERVDLELGIVEGASCFERGLGVRDRRRGICARSASASEIQPRSAQSSSCGSASAARWSQPFVGDRVAERGRVLPRDRDRDPGGCGDGYPRPRRYPVYAASHAAIAPLGSSSHQRAFARASLASGGSGPAEPRASTVPAQSCETRTPRDPAIRRSGASIGAS